MKKIFYLISLFVLLIFISGCGGYKPIFGSSELKFKIADYSIEGEKTLGKKIYYKLNNLSKSLKDNQDVKNIYFSIKVSKEKNATVKNSTGKILEYRISLKTEIQVKDFTSNNEILNKTFNYSSTYKVQDQHSETIKLENKSIETIISKIYQELLINLSQNI